MPMTLPTSQAYHLNIAGSPAPLSVVKFTGKEALSTPYRFEIDVTSPLADLATASILGKPASFTIQPVDTAAAALRALVGELADTLASPAPARVFHGLIVAFDQLSTSADQTHYKLIVQPRLADLSREVASRLFQQQSTPEMMEAVLRRAGFTANDFQFVLRNTYQTREYTTQYEETSLAFLQRLAADDGLWFRFKQAKDHEIIVVGDDLDAYDRSGLTAPMRPNAGLESSGAEAITSLVQKRQRVTQSVRLNDDNHRTAGVSLLTDANVARDDSTTAGTDYRWGEHQKDPGDAQRRAQLRHQMHLTQQVIYEGTGNVLGLAPGSVLQLSDTTLPDAPHGLVITAVAHTAARDQAYSNTFIAIPADRPYRSPPLPWPCIAGLLPAKIVSPGNYKYAYLNADGEYRVQLPFDLDTWSPGGTSRPVRLTKPYAGGNYGHHFPLIDGTEVMLAFTQGDVDRPVIIGAVHNSQRTDLVTNQNNTRNILRTPAQNELCMEDREGREHIHLTTPTHTSELNLGHMVDGQNTERGSGAELRTDGHASVRGAKGVFITADAQPGASVQQLEMQDANATLQQAINIMRALNDSANAAKAWLAEIDQQRALVEQKLTNFQKPVIVANAPEGLGIASGEHMQLAARKQMFVTAGDGLDIGVVKRITLAAGDAISFFAAQLGIKLFAAKGKVQIQAQGDAMELMALNNIAISSSTGEVSITASKGITLGDGSGAYVKIANGKVEIASPSGDIEVKGNVNIDAPAGGRFTFPNWSNTPLKDVKDNMNFGFSE